MSFCKQLGGDGTYTRRETREEMLDSSEGASVGAGACAADGNVLMYECEGDPTFTFSVEGAVDGESSTEDLEGTLIESASQSKLDGAGEWQTGPPDNRQQQQQVPEPSPGNLLPDRENNLLTS